MTPRLTSTLTALALAATLPLTQAQASAAPQAGTDSTDVPLSDVVLTRLPADWRVLVAEHVRASTVEQERFLTVAEDVLRQALARLLVRSSAADVFLKEQLVKDPSPRVRTTIAQSIAADARWMALSDTATALEAVAASDPDTAVSLAALEALRRARVRRLNTVLAERLAAAAAQGNLAALDRLRNEQERWISLERGTMLPAFLRTPPPVFRSHTVGSPGAGRRVRRFR